jgi:S1-C subfamily serine protease
LQEGDVIVAVDDRDVADLDDLQTFLLLRHVGERVRVTAVRGTDRLDFAVELKVPSHMYRVP